jgi:hypothetical protein
LKSVFQRSYNENEKNEILKEMQDYNLKFASSQQWIIIEIRSSSAGSSQFISS